MTTIFNEAVVEDTKTKVVDHSYINVILTTDNVENFRPTFGLRVQDSTHASVLAVLDRMIETGNQSALAIEVTGVTLGADYRADDSIDDPELDALMGSKKVVPLFNSQGKAKTREPVMFWVNYKVTTPYAKDSQGKDAIIRTDSTAITAKAPRQLLADLLKVTKVEMSMVVEIEQVRSATPIVPEYELQTLDF